MMKRLILVVLLAFMLGACTGNVPVAPAAPVDQEALPTPIVVQASPTPSPSPIPPTNTPVPPTDVPEPTETPLPVPIGPDNFAQDVNPLTGLKVSDVSLLNRRPVATKIQLFPRGQRPPWGVSKADIVYDYYQNNGMTRLHAIFLGQDAEQVGPIRSARLLDASLVNMYKSLLAFGGADKRIAERLFSANFSDRLITEGSGNCPPMCRVDPNGNNFLVANTAELTKFANNKGISNTRQNLNGMTFFLTPPAGGQPGTQVYNHFSISAYNRWDYDPATGKYLRFQDSQETSNGAGEAFTPLVDKTTNQQLSADNVVVILLPHSYFYRSNSGNSEIIEVQITGSGKAYAFRDGQMYEVTWNRPALDSVLYLTNADGSAFPFKPGNTWFEVMGTSTTTEMIEDSVWRFSFAIP